MRKVKFIYYIPTVRDSERNIKEGTGVYSKEMEGYFNSWGLGSEDGASYSVAIIELEDGSIITTTPERIKFVKE